MKKFLTVLLIIALVIGVIVLGLFILNKVNESAMLEYIDTFSPVGIEGQLEPSVDEHGNYYFVTDEDFKVLHLTDVHIGGGILFSELDKKAINAVAAMVSAEKPDLVVVTGDISFAVPWTGTLDNSYAHSFFKRLMERLGVYWTVTFGNHDSEGYNFHNREAVAAMYEDESLEYCLFSRGPRDIYGECNHVINVKNSKGLITESLVMIDTNSYTEDDPLGLFWDYDNIHEDQIEWYRNVIELYAEQNDEVYSSLPSEEQAGLTPELKSMMFMHIPIAEVKDAYDEYVNNGRQNTEDVQYLSGNDGESDQVVYCSLIEEEMFETILELGSTEALFYGHDHLNNFVMSYKGVMLSYGYSIDYGAYSGIDKLGYQRGCTVITISPKAPFMVKHENYYQDKYESLYEKESVNMDK